MVVFVGLLVYAITFQMSITSALCPRVVPMGVIIFASCIFSEFLMEGRTVVPTVRKGVAVRRQVQ